MQVGGNTNAVRWPTGLFLPPEASLDPPSFCLQTAFFRQHGCSTNDTNAKYNSRAAQMYREKIRQLANAALSKYGTDVSLGLLLRLPRARLGDVTEVIVKVSLSCGGSSRGRRYG